MDFQHYLDKALNFIMDNAFNVFIALLILVIGLWLVNKIVALLRKIMNDRGIDLTLQKFLGDLLGWGMKILVVITAISQVGVETTSFIAILGAAGLAVGLALQGTLANFAGGALIMVFKPFKVGDLIQAQGEIGVVNEIQIFVTTLKSPENRAIIIPNGLLSNGIITNFTKEGQLRVDLTIGISYDADIKTAKTILTEVLNAHEQVLKDPAPSVNVIELGDSSVNFAVRPWTKPEHYWTVYFDVLERSKNALDKAGIEIPYPHQVHIKK